MEEPIKSRKDLYRNALPDFISLFWAYCRSRMQDGVEIIHPGYTGKKNFYFELGQAKDFVVELDIHIQMSLEGLLEEFYVLITQRNKSFVNDLSIGIPSNLENKYGKLLRSPQVIQLVTTIESYMRKDSHLRGNAYIPDKNFKISNSGLHTAADTTTWAAILSYALGDQFNINAFLRVAASVDIFYVHDFVEGLGVVTQRAQEEKNDRNTELLDPKSKSYIDMESAESYTLRKTVGCPAMFTPSEEMQELIRTNFPDQNPKETMMEGLGKKIPSAIRNLIQDFINELGLEAFQDLIRKQEPILREYLEKGFIRENSSEFSFK